MGEEKRGRREYRDGGNGEKHYILRVRGKRSKIPCFENSQSMPVRPASKNT
jgi:hypothetical protein